MKGERAVSILSNRNIVERVLRGDLVLDPFDLDRVGSESVDLCLSGDYLVFERVWVLDSVDLSGQQQNGFLTGNISACVEEAHYASLTLRPGRVVVASLREHLEIPPDLVGYIDGRSKWARLGLQVASAGLVHAGWSGKPVLELVNLGDLPLSLSEGLPVCQIFFHDLTSPVLSPNELRDFWEESENVQN